MTDLPRPAPTRAPDIAPYWEGTARGELVLPRCRACAHLIWYPRSICPACSSRDIAWERLSGLGTVYSMTTVRRAPGEFSAALPYVLAYVELDEGPRVLTNILIDGEAPAIGARVRAVFEAVDDRMALLRFTLLDA